MNIGICYNPTKENIVDALEIFVKTLHSNGFNCKVFEDFPTEKLDYLFVMGGDGTVLRYVNYAVTYEVPLVGINLGSKGFLTAFSEQDFSLIVDCLKDNNFDFKEQNLFKVSINGKYKVLGLNDAVLERCSDCRDVSEVIRFNLKINGDDVDTYFADGIIVATPTGSTAYSLSAGGSIVVPGLNAFIVTPVCPHSLRSRPIVFPNDFNVSVTILKDSNDCTLFVDGKKVDNLKQGDYYTVEKLDKKLKLAMPQEKFFDRLNSKITIWNNYRR